jgi:8-oxo-dGTP diphosphatase
MVEVNFYEPSFEPEIHLTYSVITARYDGKWIYVRHNNRNTWEIPGGHIEEGENSDEAAARELAEETGAIEFVIVCVATYSVTEDTKKGYGRLYLAYVHKLGNVPDVSEIAEIRLQEDMPDNLTYPEIQPFLFEKVIEFLTTK